MNNKDKSLAFSNGEFEKIYDYIADNAEFLRDNKRVSFVSACDLYEFNDNDQIQKITSYCIQQKKD